ncbi:MAG: OmpA family protein [Bradymonadaceae bacterium]|nr:OmpA family protein [Lujinxingiaceae bacterium]
MGCKPGPESEELLELERMLQDPKALEIRDSPGASRFFQEARQFRRVAREAHDERKDDLSREYAVLGTLRYRTAVAIAMQFEAKQRLDSANVKLEEVNPVLRATNAERNKLVGEVTQLEQQIGASVRARAENERQQADQNKSTFQAANTTSQTSLAQVHDRIREVEAVRAKALEVKADQFAKALFDRADGQLHSARDLANSQPGATDIIMQQVEHAMTMYREAQTSAEPLFKDAERKMQPDNRIAAIRTESQNNFGAPYTITEFNGVRIVMARLFEPQTGNFRFNTESLIDALAKVCQDYGEFTISIEGYTQRKGGATENLATSQLRAHKVRDYLINKGVKSERITTEGFGQDRLRYTDSADNNDRVEIILRHSR